MTNRNSNKIDQDSLIFIISKITDLIMFIVQWTAWPLCIYFSIKELAGKETILNVIVNYFSKTSNSAPWSLSILFFIWALGERVVRHKKTANMSEHIKRLEIIIDPNRSSSNLTKSGQTPRPNTKLRKK